MNILLKTCVLIGIISTSLLSAEYSGKGWINIAHKDGRYAQGATIQGVLDFRWKIWSLMGEPVDMLEARWNIVSINFDGDELSQELRSPIGGSLVYEVCGNEETLNCIPKHIMETASIIDLKINATMDGYYSGAGTRFIEGSGAAVGYVFDAGVMSKPAATYNKDEYGPWSYNTPGSPSWEKSFIFVSNYHDAETSKDIMKQGFKANYHTIEEIKFNLNELKRYIIKRNDAYYAEEEHERYDELVRKSDDPFEVLEKMDKEKSSGKIVRKKNIKTYVEYETIERKLEEEAKEKKSILQLTKERVAKRVKPVKKNDDEYYWLDKKTGLTWTTNMKAPEISWTEATNYCRGLNALGSSNWHLPSVDDLLSLFERRANLIIANEEVYNHDYWSSKSGVAVVVSAGRRLGSSNEVSSWYDTNRNPKHRVTCISKNVNEKPYEEVYTDNSTGLMWQDNSDTKTIRRNWEDAKSYCQNLTLAGHSDWHLPNKEQLLGLHREKGRLKNLVYFSYWSSTTDADDTSYAWDVNLRDDGVQYNSNRDSEHLVRCVRGGQ